VTAPELVAPLALSLSDGTPTLATGTVGLTIQVDEKGFVHDVKVTRPLNAYWDARVAQAVSNGHFRPATLDHQAIPMSVDLTVAVAK
jgi:TonB family protein